MNSNYRFIGAFGLLFLFMTAAAGPNKIGNGGDIVFCPNHLSDKAQILDFYESKTKPVSSESDPYKIAEQVFKNIEKSAPKLAAQYLNRLSQISKEIEFKKDVKLTDIADSNHLFEPSDKDCSFLQAAIRQNEKSQDGKRFIVRQDLWSELSPVQQAGLLTHEILYEHLAKLGEVDSSKVRKINIHLYQDAKSRKDIWVLMRDLRLPIYP